MSRLVKPPLALVLALVFLPTTASTRQSEAPAKLPLSSKTICVVVTDSTALQTAIADRLREWGRLTVVSRLDQADLVLEVSEREVLTIYSEVRPDEPRGPRWHARVTHRGTGQELWSTTKGEGTWGEAGSAAFTQQATAWTAREIAKDFAKYYYKTKRKGRG